MSDLKNFFRDLGYFSVGAAAVLVETGSKAVGTLVKKGKKTLSDNQDTVDAIKRKASQAGERIKDALEKVTTAPEESDLDADPAAPDAIYHTEEPVPVEEPCPEEPVVTEPTVEKPEVQEPIIEVPEETVKPEDTVNG